MEGVKESVVAVDDEKSVVVITGTNTERKGGDLVFDTGSTNLTVDISEVVRKMRMGADFAGPLVTLGTAEGSPSGEIVFNIGKKEVLRINSEGRFIREGAELGEDKEVLIIFRSFLGYMCAALNIDNRSLHLRDLRIAALEEGVAEANKAYLDAQQSLGLWRDWAAALCKKPGLDAEMRKKISEELLDWREASDPGFSNHGG